MKIVRGITTSLLCAALLACGATALHAQPAAKGPPNALQGFSQNRDQPVHIEAATLEVRDKDKVATFSGDVHVQQGDTNMRCKSLVVYYEQDAKGSNGGDNSSAKLMTSATPGPGGNQQIKRLEAHGGVVVTQKQQTATGDKGIFDMKANTVTLTGNVVMTQGKNVLRGDRLVVNLTSGVSRVDGSSGRVQMLVQPGSGNALPAPGASASPEPYPRRANGREPQAPMSLRPRN